MHQDAPIVIRVACQMLSRHGEQAALCAQARAAQLADEPRAAARWRMVEETISLLYADGYAPAD